MDKLKSSLEESKEIHFYDILAIFIYRQRVFFMTVLMVFAAVYYIQGRAPRIYSTFTTIVLSSEAASEKSSKTLADVFQTNDYYDENFYKTQFEIINSSRVMKSTADEINRKIKEEYPTNTEIQEFLPIHPGQVKGSIKVETNPDTDIITIIAQHKHPLMAKIICSGVAEMFIKFDYESRYKTEENIARNLEKRLDTVKGILNESLMKLLNFKKENATITLSESSDTDNILYQKHDSLSKELNTAITTRILAESEYKHYHGKDYAKTIIDSPGYQQQLNLLLRANEEKASMKNKFGSRHPKMVAIANKISQIRENLKMEYISFVNSLKTKFEASASLEKSLRANLQQLRTEIFDQTAQNAEYNKLLREVETNQKIYQLMLEGTKEAHLKKLMIRPNFKILDDAVDPEEKKSSKNLPISAALAFVVGVIVVFIIEYLDTSIKYPETIREEIGLQIFGTLPSRETNFDELRTKQSTLDKLRSRKKKDAA